MEIMMTPTNNFVYSQNAKASTNSQSKTEYITLKNKEEVDKYSAVTTTLDLWIPIWNYLKKNCSKEENTMQNVENIDKQTAYNKTTTQGEKNMQQRVVDMSSNLNILSGTLGSLDVEERKFLKYCCDLPYIQYVTIIDNGSYGKAEFWLFLTDYNTQTTDELMIKCLDYFDKNDIYIDALFLTEDQVDKKEMPEIKVTAKAYQGRYC